jgi:hypothetical protein
MFRKIANSLRTFLKSSSFNEGTHSTISDINTALLAISKKNESFISMGEEDQKKYNAYRSLNDAMRELSNPISSTTSLKSVPSKSKQILDLISQSSSSFENLSTSQLEEIARVYYDGIEGGILTKDEAKSVEIWTLAAERGSIEAKYSLASCLRERVGVRVARDPTAAFEGMLSLATSHNYNLAHVSRHISLFTHLNFCLFQFQFQFIIFFFSLQWPQCFPGGKAQKEMMPKPSTTSKSPLFPLKIE